MARTQYFDDPNAPTPNRIVPAASVAVRDSNGALLLEWRQDNGLWTLPGGLQELGESIRETAVREVWEETGIEVEITGLVGIYSDPRHVIAYSDGEVRQQFNICFAARAVGGSLRASSESRAVRWVAPDHLDGLPIDRAIRLRIAHALEQRSEPYLG